MDDIIILLNFIFTSLHGYEITPGLSTNKQRHRRQYIKRLENKIHTTVRRNLEEILEVKTFPKMSIGCKCRGPKVELRFCSFVGCVHFSTTGKDKEK